MDDQLEERTYGSHTVDLVKKLVARLAENSEAWGRGVDDFATYLDRDLTHLSIRGVLQCYNSHHESAIYVDSEMGRTQ